MGRRESLKPRLRKLRTSGKPHSPTNWSINPTSQNMPRKPQPMKCHHYAFKTERNPKSHLQPINLSYSKVVMPHHDDHRIEGQLTGPTNPSPNDDLNNTDKDIVRRARWIPTLLMQTTLPFNTANYTQSGYRINCMSRRSTLKPHNKALNVTQRNIKATITTPTVRSYKNVYKALTISTQGTKYSNNFTIIL